MNDNNDSFERLMTSSDDNDFVRRLRIVFNVLLKDKPLGLTTATQFND